MMNMNFIKWVCDKADGFEAKYVDNYRLKQLVYIHENVEHLCDLFYSEHSHYYPLLLQRACEAISKNSAFTIIITCDVSIKDMNGNYVADHWRMSDIDEAKEAALLWVYKQETK